MSKPIKIDPALLATELAWLAKSKSKTRTYGAPALQAVQVSTLVGALRLRHTDLELYRESVLPAGGGGQASVLVDPAKLRELLKGAFGFALVDVTDTGLSITVDGRAIKLRAAAGGEDYPDWPVFVSGNTGAALVTARQLKRALTSVGDDDTLPMLKGVRFEDAMMVSTDRFRLSRIAYTAHGKPMGPVLVPGEALQAFTRSEDLITIDHGRIGDVEGGAVQVSSGEQRSIIARVSDAEFPKWKQLIPAEDTVPLVAVIRRDQLLDAIGTGDNVTLTVRPDSILVCSTDRDGDVEVEQQIDIVVLLRGDNLPFTVRMSRKNLGGCLKGIAAGALKFMATSATKPVVLQGVGDGDLHLVMPVRIPDGQGGNRVDAESAG